MLTDISSRLERIRALDLGFLRKKFMKKYPRYAYRFDECAHELKRLFELALYARSPIEVTSLAVDGLWDEFAQSEGYERFCAEVYGKRLEVQPTGPQYGGKQAQAFYRLYEKHFGEVPVIWREDAPGKAP